MLGVMNEKFLFNGKYKIPCKWKLFIATCNEIPKDEVNSPFWDRFMLKHKVNRVTAGELLRYYDKGGRNYKEKFSINIPTKHEVESVNITKKRLEKYLEVGYKSTSDRTLTFVPTLAKAVSFIWDCSVDKALVKTAQIMISQAASSDLQNKLISPEVKAILSKIELLKTFDKPESLGMGIAEIEQLIGGFAGKGSLDQEQVTELEMTLQYALENHPVKLNAEDIDNAFNDLMEETDKQSDLDSLLNGSDGQIS